MKDIHLTLQRSIAFSFYQQHTGMFFFVFFLMFGVVESTQLVSYHLSLIYGMLSSTLFLLLVMGVWLLYFLKCLHFVLKTTDATDYFFLTHLATVSRLQTFSVFLFLQFTLFLPVSIYTIIILAVAVKSGFYYHTILILFYQVSFWLFSSWVITRNIHQKHINRYIKIPSFQIPVDRPLPLFYTSHLLRQQKVGVLISKLFSIAIIYIVLQTMDPFDDIRIALLAFLFGLISHSFLVFELKRFENEHLHWLRTLPISLYARFLYYFAIYSIILLPEMIMWTASIGKKISFSNWLLLYSFGTSFLVCLHVRLFKSEQTMDTYTQFLLLFFLFSFFLILCKLAIILPLTLLFIAYLLFTQRFYVYEPTPGSN